MENPIDNSISTRKELTFRVVFQQIRQYGIIPSFTDDMVKFMDAECLSHGYITDIFRVKFSYAKTPEVATHNGGDCELVQSTCILKVPIVDKLVLKIMDESRLDGPSQKLELVLLVDFITAGHNTECLFYEKVLPIIDAEVPFRIPNLLSGVPFKWGITPEGLVEEYKKGWKDAFLLISDLAQNGMPIGCSLVEGLSPTQVESLIIALAHFHASTIQLPEHLIKQFDERPGNFDLTEEEIHIVKRLCEEPETREYFSKSENRELLLLLVEKHGAQQKHAQRRFGIHPVLCHGDFWTDNFHFKLDPKTERAEIVDAIFDWQTVYAGTGINDLLRLVFTSVEPEYRRKYFLSDWLPLYQHTFQKCLQRKGFLDLTTGRELERMRDEILPYHQNYELIFALFLTMNWVTRLKVDGTSGQRKIIIRRAQELFEDMKDLI